MAHLIASDVYFGTYARIQTDNTREGAALAGPDNAVGDIGSIEWRTEQQSHQQAWYANPYGIVVASFDLPTSHTLAVYQAKGWIVHPILSFVAYSANPGHYWGEVAVIAYAPRYANQFEQFLKSFAHQVAEGLRPDPNLTPMMVEAVIAKPSSWKPTSKVKLPHGDEHTSIIKDHRSLYDRMLDQGRKNNPGCYLASLILITVLIASVIGIMRLVELV